MGELFGSCASAGVVCCVYPQFVAITHRHRIAPPPQCDLLHVTATAVVAIAIITTTTVPPTPRHNTAMDVAHNALLQPARSNARALTLAQTAQPYYHNAQTVHCMRTQHQCRRQGPRVSPGTRQCCPAQQRGKLRRSATSWGWK